MPKVPESFEQLLDSALDKAIAVERPVVRRYLDRAREKNPAASPPEVVELLEKHYRRVVMGIGAAAGASAALPGVGTAATVAAGVVEIGAFVSATGLFTLALAEVYDIPTHDPDVRRALVLAVLVGEGSASAIAAGGFLAADARKHWAEVIGRTASKDSVRSMNGRLLRHAATRWGTRQGVLLAGRALPLGIGAGVGYVGNGALAKAAINSSRVVFGPPPARMPGRVVDG